MNGSTTPARNGSRRSSVRCGSPIPWASARAWATALAEQQERSASCSGSAHSSSVTATPRRRRGRELGGERAVDAAAHRHQRRGRAAGGPSAARRGAASAAPSARASASAASSAAWSLPGLRPPSSAAISAGADPRRLEHGAAAGERHRGAPGGGGRAAAVGVKPASVDRRRRPRRDRERQLVAAGPAAAGDRVRRPGGDGRGPGGRSGDARRPARPRRVEHTQRGARVLLDRQRVGDALGDLEPVGEPDELGGAPRPVDDQQRRRAADRDLLGRGVA